MVFLLLTPLPVLSSTYGAQRPSDTTSPSLHTSLASAPHSKVSPKSLFCFWRSVLLFYALMS